MPHLGPGADRRVRVQERLLNDVLGAPVTVEAARDAEQRAVVPLDDLGERALVAAAGKRDQALVGFPVHSGLRTRSIHTRSDVASAADVPVLLASPCRPRGHRRLSNFL
jgi:hypothetical protein